MLPMRMLLRSFSSSMWSWTSSNSATAKTSSSLAKPMRLQEPRYESSQVEGQRTGCRYEKEQASHNLTAIQHHCSTSLATRVLTKKWSRVQRRVRGYWPTTPTLTLKYPYPEPSSLVGALCISSTGTIPEVTTRIKDHLASHPELETYICFARLYQEGCCCVAILTPVTNSTEISQLCPTPLNKLEKLPPRLESFPRTHLKCCQLVHKHTHAHSPLLNQDLGHYKCLKWPCCHQCNQHLTFCTRIMVLCWDNNDTNPLLAYKFMQ